MTDNIVDQFKAMSQLPPEVKYKILVPNPNAILKSGHLTYAAFDENLNFIGTIEVFDANRFGKKSNQPSRGSGDGFFKFIPSGEQTTLITPTQHYTQTVIDAPEEIINLMRKVGVNFAEGGDPQVIARVQVFNGETSYSGYEVSFEAHVTMADGSVGSITFTKVQQLVDMGPGPWMEVSGWVGTFEGKNGNEVVNITTPEFALFASNPTDPDGHLYPVIRNPITGKLERVPEEGGGGYKSFSVEEYIDNLGVEGRRTIEEMQEFEQLLNASEMELNGLREETLREFDLQQEESLNVQLAIDSIADLPEGATSFIPDITFDLSDVVFDPAVSSAGNSIEGIEGNYDSVTTYDENGNVNNVYVRLPPMARGGGDPDDGYSYIEFEVLPDGSVILSFITETNNPLEIGATLKFTNAFLNSSRANFNGLQSAFEDDLQYNADLQASEAMVKALFDFGIDKEDLKRDIYIRFLPIIKSLGSEYTTLQFDIDIVQQTKFGVPVFKSNGDVEVINKVLVPETGSGFDVPAEYKERHIIRTDFKEITDSYGEILKVAQTIIETEAINSYQSVSIIKELVDGTNDIYIKTREIDSTVSEDATVKKTKLFDEQGNITSESTDVFIKGTNISVGQIGSIFGSTIGRQLTDSQLGSIALGTVLGAIGQNLFQTIGLAALGGKDLGTAIDTALGDFGVDLTSAGRGAVSSFLVGQLLGVIGLNGVEGEVLQTTVGSTLTSITNNIIAGNAWDAGVSTANFANIMGGFVGAKLASEIISFDTVGGQIGASVGGAAGAYAVGELFGKVLGNFLAPGIGAFVGFIVGGLLGSLFGGTPRSAADVLFNPDTGEFGVDNTWSAKGGSKEGAEQLASIAAANLNGILAAIGGTVVNEGRLSGGTYGTRKSDYTYRVDGGSYGPGDPGKQTIAKTFDGDNPDAASLLIEHGVLNALDDLQIAGGDVFLKRALYGSLDTLMTGSNVISSIQGEAINVILGNFQTAADYRTYIENAATINALIAAEPESAFTAGWIITLQRVSEIGLNKRNVSDWLGGYKAWAVTNEVQSLGALTLNPYINAAGQSDRRFILTDQNGFTRRIYDTVTQSSNTAANDNYYRPITSIHKGGRAA